MASSSNSRRTSPAQIAYTLSMLSALTYLVLLVAFYYQAHATRNSFGTPQSICVPGIGLSELTVLHVLLGVVTVGIAVLAKSMSHRMRPLALFLVPSQAVLLYVTSDQYFCGTYMSVRPLAVVMTVVASVYVGLELLRFAFRTQGSHMLDAGPNLPMFPKPKQPAVPVVPVPILLTLFSILVDIYGFKDNSMLSFFLSYGSALLAFALGVIALVNAGRTRRPLWVALTDVVSVVFGGYYGVFALFVISTWHGVGSS